MKEVIIILEKYITILSNCSLFKNIKPEEILTILNCMKAKIVQYRSGDVIVSVDNKLNDIYIVLDGIVEISRNNINGNKIIMNKVYKGEIFGEMIALSNINEPYITINTLVPSIILSLQTNIIKTPCQNSCYPHNLLISNIIQELANKAIFLNSRIQYLSIKSIRAKLCTFLYNKYIKSGKTKFTIKFNRNELADFLNVSRPSMSRELGKLRDENILYFKGYLFELLDIEKIVSYVE